MLNEGGRCIDLNSMRIAINPHMAHVIFNIDISRIIKLRNRLRLNFVCGVGALRHRLLIPRGSEFGWIKQQGAASLYV